MFIAALFTIAKIWKQPKRSWTDKDAICICNGILLGHEKERNSVLYFLTARKDLEVIVFSEISHTQNDKYSML